jgi:para-aminobenzoate synthetase component I
MWKYQGGSNKHTYKVGERMLSDTIHRVNHYSTSRIPFLLIVDFELENTMVFPLSELPENILFQTPEYINNERPSGQPGSYRFRKTPVDYETYLERFQIVRENTLAGKTYLTNLTFPTEVHTDLNLKKIYLASNAKYKLLFRDDFVVFSPETFVQIRNGKISSRPMKGTIDADIPDARSIILEDEKEMAEHVTIVDLIRNDMSIHASNVKVDRFRYIDTLNTNNKRLLQVSSVISGDLPQGFQSSLGDILFSMLPAGSISGAPKQETLRIIREAEGKPRGFYTGIMGYFDGRNFDSAVLIRFIENHDGRMVYRSGGGITCMSEPEKEYQELVDKVYIPLV